MKGIESCTVALGEVFESILAILCLFSTRCVRRFVVLRFDFTSKYSEFA